MVQKCCTTVYVAAWIISSTRLIGIFLLPLLPPIGPGTLGTYLPFFLFAFLPPPSFPPPARTTLVDRQDTGRSTLLTAARGPRWEISSLSRMEIAPKD